MSERVESRFSEIDMTPEGGCSEAFKKSFRSFLDEYGKSLEKTIDTFKSVENLAAKENSEIQKKIVKNISGVTSKQLEVLNVIFNFLTSLLYYYFYCYCYHYYCKGEK